MELTASTQPRGRSALKECREAGFIAGFFHCLPFVAFHIATVVLVVLAGVPSWQAILFCVGLYYLRMFGITAGYHRYFSHRAFKTSRVGQFFLAFLGNLSLQKGVLWWAAHHRHHHRYSDAPEDVHSPRDGLWWSHAGWILAPSSKDVRWDQIKDMSKFPELRFLNHYGVMVLQFAALCVLTLFTLGFEYLVYGCFVSTVLLFHGTFTINSLSHVFGKRVYATTDTSKNSMLLALITMGEGWHNNHHYYMSSANQGFHWWQLDMSYWILCVAEKLHLVWDVKRPGPEVVAGKLGRRNWLIADGAEDGGTPVAAATVAEQELQPAA